MTVGKRRLAIFGGKVALGLGALYLVTLPFRSVGDDRDSVVALPILLKQVQGLGELHTSKYHYENVLEYSTHRQPAEWAKHIPIVADAVRSTTNNNALVSVNGEVQAGFNLDEATVTRENGRIIVTLPKPVVYPARVEAKVHKYARGLLWRDMNIGLKAERDAAVRFRNASIEQGIEEHATTEVKKRVIALLQPATDESIEVRIL